MWEEGRVGGMLAGQIGFGSESRADFGKRKAFVSNYKTGQITV
jgi:hypothetical protein